MEVKIYTKEMRKDILKLDIQEVELKELKALYGSKFNTKQILDDCIKSSVYLWVAYEDNKVIAVGGLSLHPLEQGIGIPWLLSSDLFVKKYLFTMNSLTMQLIEFCFTKLDLYLLTNQVSLENKASIKWLKYLGFEFMEQPKYINNVWFDNFYLYKEDYLCVSQ